MTRKEILAAAEKCVCGDREQDYGIPENSFRLIAEFWHTYLSAKCVAAGVHVQLEPEDVAAMMALLKIARLMSNPEHVDSWIDGAGYLACGGEVATLGGGKIEYPQRNVYQHNGSLGNTPSIF